MKSGISLDKDYVPSGGDYRRFESKKVIVIVLTLGGMLRSIRKNFAEFTVLLEDLKPDVFGITESWLREDIDSAEVSHPGYVVYRQDRRDTHNGVGGGVLLYVRDDIVSVEKSQLQGSFVNSVWCELSTNNSKRSRDVITVVLFTALLTAAMIMMSCCLIQLERLLKVKQKVKDAIVSLRAPQADKIVTDSQDLADLLNDYFVSVFTREDTSSIPDFQGGDRPKLDTVLFSDDVVLKELLRLNVSKASGPDAIHPYLLKTFAHYFCVPLSLIFSKFMDEGYVPRDWRCANITPIFKKGDKTKPCNYRPVSLTSVVCKVMESIVKKSLVCHFSSQSLIRWQMLFNIDKCKVMHIGSSNQKFTYNLNGVELQEVSVERDLGIYIDSSLQPSKHCLEAAKRGNRVLGMIKRNFSFLKEDIVVRLYKQLVRPHLEYAVQAWNPYFAKDKEVLEKVQRRATRMISSLKRVPYYRRLQLLNLTTLELRRLRGDLIQVFKIVYGFDNLSFTDFFMFANSSCTRGHCLKLQKSHSRINIRHNFFLIGL
ncbi:hypothetical protein BSL78_16576 [Apostichopus japonicus]|uniref:RNA-directed DNA polymerase from mobile element jockey-like n=1 Tax=Stichopus japonicus TaxID=307972 RepID=A0A2G8KEY4_STIJA|nr:hypothetical protein BSL78_16576 [Apostichopus japonicus]